ncbi:MAG: hypothetical protein IPN18_21395 [Ignavibacteriales bacterium]|nr:hypothetical protein [Ignavibacteriales bacterium]
MDFAKLEWCSDNSGLFFIAIEMASMREILTCGITGVLYTNNKVITRPIVSCYLVLVNSCKRKKVVLSDNWGELLPAEWITANNKEDIWGNETEIYVLKE